MSTYLIPSGCCIGDLQVQHAVALYALSDKSQNRRKEIVCLAGFNAEGHFGFASAIQSNMLSDPFATKKSFGGITIDDKKIGWYRNGDAKEKTDSGLNGVTSLLAPQGLIQTWHFDDKGGIVEYTREEGKKIQQYRKSRYDDSTEMTCDKKVLTVYMDFHKKIALKMKCARVPFLPEVVKQFADALTELTPLALADTQKEKSAPEPLFRPAQWNFMMHMMAGDYKNVATLHKAYTACKTE